MAWVLVGLQMEENSMTEKEMIEAWVKKNKPKPKTPKALGGVN